MVDLLLALTKLVTNVLNILAVLVLLDLVRCRQPDDLDLLPP